MNRPVRLAAFLAAAALLLGSLAAAPAAAKDEDRPGKGTPRLGGFERPAGDCCAVAGRYVSFEWSPEGIRNYTVNGTRLFDVDLLPPAESAGKARVTGSTINVDGPGFSLRAHDNPTGGLKLSAAGDVEVRLAAGAVATAESGHLRVDFGAVVGRIFGDDDLALSGQRIRAEEDLRFVLAEPVSSVDTERPALAKAAAQKKIGAEISLSKGKPADVVQLAGNVTARILRSPEQGHRDLLVQVEGHGFDGRVIVLNVDGAVLGAVKRDDLHVEYDNVTIRAAEGGLADVLNPDDDGLHPEYWLGHDPLTGSFQLAVSVPHYSVHEIRVQSLLAEAPVSIVVGVVAAFAVLAVSAFALFRPRRG